jgi:hypothetical protein
MEGHLDGGKLILKEGKKMSKVKIQLQRKNIK